MAVWLISVWLALLLCQSGASSLVSRVKRQASNGVIVSEVTNPAIINGVLGSLQNPPGGVTTIIGPGSWAPGGGGGGRPCQRPRPQRPFLFPFRPQLQLRPQLQPWLQQQLWLQQQQQWGLPLLQRPRGPRGRSGAEVESSLPVESPSVPLPLVPLPSVPLPSVPSPSVPLPSVASSLEAATSSPSSSTSQSQ